MFEENIKFRYITPAKMVNGDPSSKLEELLSLCNKLEEDKTAKSAMGIYLMSNFEGGGLKAAQEAEVLQ